MQEVMRRIFRLVIQWRRGLAEALILGLVLAFPLAGALCYWRTFLARERAAQEQALAEDLRAMTLHAARLAEPSTALGGTIERVCVAIAQGDDPSRLLGDWPSGAIEIFAFDLNGKRLTGPGLPSGKKVVSEVLLRMIRRQFAIESCIDPDADPQLKAGLAEPTRSERRLAEAFVGSPQVISLLVAQPNRLVSLEPLGQMRLVGWFQLRDETGNKGFLFCRIDSRKIPPDLVATRAVRRVATLARPAGFEFAWLSLKSAEQGQTMHGRPLSSTWRRLLARPLLRPQFAVGSYLVASADLETDIRIIGAAQRRPLHGRHTHIWPWALIAACFALIVLRFLWGGSLAMDSPALRSMHQSGEKTSLRTQLIVIFGLAAGAGLVALLGFSHAYREVRTASTLRLGRQQALRILEQIDSSFLPYFQSLVPMYQRLTRSIPHDLIGLETVLQELRKAHKKGDFDLAMVINSEGRTLFQIPDPARGETLSGFAQPFSQPLARFAQQIIQRFNAWAIVEVATECAKVAEEPRDRNLQQSGPSRSLIEGPIIDVLRQRQQLHVIVLLDEETVNFLDFILHPDGTAAACLVILHDKRQLARQYVAERRQGMANNPAGRLVALPRSHHSRLPPLPGPGILQISDLLQLHKLVQRTESPHARRINVQGNEMLVTGMPGHSIDHYDLFLLTPIEPILEEIRHITHTFTAVAGITLLFTLLLGWLLTDLFLPPMREISRGIGLLSHLQLHDRISVAAHDEWRQISDGINQMLEDMQEFAIAKTVQEQLLPTAPLISGPLRAQGWCRHATEIGSEFFDLLVCPDGRIVCLTATISSEGVSAALIMAMMKMSGRLFLEQFDGDTLKTTHAIDHHLRLNVRQKLQMSFLLCQVCPESGDTVLCCSRFGEAPDMYAVVLRKTGMNEALDLQTPDTTVGMRVARTVLHVGDRLVVASRGVTLTSHSEQPDPGEDWLSRLRAISPDKAGTLLDFATTSPSTGSRVPADGVATDRTLILFSSQTIAFGGSSG